MLEAVCDMIVFCENMCAEKKCHNENKLFFNLSRQKKCAVEGTMKPSSLAGSGEWDRKYI